MTSGEISKQNQQEYWLIREISKQNQQEYWLIGEWTFDEGLDRETLIHALEKVHKRHSSVACGKIVPSQGVGATRQYDSTDQSATYTNEIQRHPEIVLHE